MFMVVLFCFIFTGCTENQYSEKQLGEASAKMKDYYLTEMDHKTVLGIDTVRYLAERSEIQDALAAEDESIAVDLIEETERSIRDSTKHSDFQLHAHTAQKNCMFKHWKDANDSECFILFRHSIKYAKQENDIIHGFEVGHEGLLLRAVAPVLKDDIYMGTIESLQSVASIVEDLNEENEILIFFMHENRLDVATDLKGCATCQGLAVAQEKVDTDFFESLKSVDIHKLYTEDYLVHDGYLISGVVIVDVSGLDSGVAVLGKRLSDIR